MPSRSEIIREITKAARAAGLTFEKDREGGKHTIYKLDGLQIAVSRQKQFGQRYAEMVYKECEPKLGRGWWR